MSLAELTFDVLPPNDVDMEAGSGLDYTCSPLDDVEPPSLFDTAVPTGQPDHAFPLSTPSPAPSPAALGLPHSFHQRAHSGSSYTWANEGASYSQVAPMMCGADDGRQPSHVVDQLRGQWCGGASGDIWSSHDEPSPRLATPSFKTAAPMPGQGSYSYAEYLPTPATNLPFRHQQQPPALYKPGVHDDTLSQYVAAHKRQQYLEDPRRPQHRKVPSDSSLPPYMDAGMTSSVPNYIQHQAGYAAAMPAATKTQSIGLHAPKAISTIMMSKIPSVNGSEPTEVVTIVSSQVEPDQLSNHPLLKGGFLPSNLPDSATFSKMYNASQELNALASANAAAAHKKRGLSNDFNGPVEAPLKRMRAHAIGDNQSHLHRRVGSQESIGAVVLSMQQEPPRHGRNLSEFSMPDLARLQQAQAASHIAEPAYVLQGSLVSPRSHQVPIEQQSHGCRSFAFAQPPAEPLQACFSIPTAPRPQVPISAHPVQLPQPHVVVKQEFEPRHGRNASATSFASSDVFEAVAVPSLGLLKPDGDVVPKMEDDDILGGESQESEGEGMGADDDESIGGSDVGEDHDDGRNIIYSCDYPACDKTFKSRYSHRRHRKQHTGERPHRCPHPGCASRFAERSTLTRHIRVHTGEKPYRCSFPGCPRSFADRTNVKRHQMTHTGKKPYHCPYDSCGRTYSRRCYLTRHIKATHNPSTDPDLAPRLAYTKTTRRDR